MRIIKTIKIFFLYLHSSACRRIGLLSPRKSRRMVFGSWFGEKYDDNSKALFEHVIASHPEIDALWITKSPGVHAELKSKGLPCAMSKSMRALRYALTAKNVVYCTSPDDARLVRFFPFYSGATFINLWHGVPLKKIKYDDTYALKHKEEEYARMNPALRYWHKKFDNLNLKVEADTYNVATSAAFCKIYEGVFACGPERIWNLGQARNDYFFTPHANSIRNQYPGKKIIAYLPTHRNAGKTEMDLDSLLDLQAINDLCASNNAVFIIKKHFYHHNDREAGASLPCIIDLTRQDVKTQELIDAADVLITDYSSVYIDYLLLDRPILFYAYDLADYLATDRQMYQEYDAETMPGPICADFPTLLAQLQQLLAGEDAYAAKRLTSKDYYYSKENQGPVAEKQLQAILSLNEQRRTNK